MRHARSVLHSAQRLRKLAWPPFDLLVRLWLAQLFLVSGLLKLGAWAAIRLAQFRPPAPGQLTQTVRNEARLAGRPEDTR